MIVRGRETGWGPIDQSAGILGMWSGVPFFSGVVTLSNSVGDSRNVAICGLREIRMVEGHTRTKCRKCVACWSGFSCRVYIDSNRSDSRI
jgi:hypothetical protein